MTTYPRIKMSVRELQLGDTVRTGSLDGWDTAIVCKVDDLEVTLFRPYGTTADFSCTMGVICYVGLEEFKVQRNNSITYEVLRRQDLK